MKKLLFASLAALTYPVLAQITNLDNSPYNMQNSPYNMDNSPYNMRNSPYNMDNSPYNASATNGVYDNTGTPVNLKEAHRYLSRAVALGHDSFNSRLADYYQNGIGCEADPQEAAIINFHSAFRSNAHSYSNLLSLAKIYSQGLVVAKNYVFAYALTNFSAAAGNKASAEFRDELEIKMSPEQIGKAQELSLQWEELDDIKTSKFFPEWLSSKPAFLDLAPEANAKNKQDRKRNSYFAEAILKALKNAKDS